LKQADERCSVDLQPLVADIYEQASYDVRIDYEQPVPSPKLREADQQWMLDLLNV
jgi:hypothetical protein